MFLRKWTLKFQYKFFSFGQFATGVKIKIKSLHLAVPPSFTVVKGTEGFKEYSKEPWKTCITN